MDNSTLNKKMVEFKANMWQLIKDMQDTITDATGSALFSSRPNLKKSIAINSLHDDVHRIAEALNDFPDSFTY